MGQGTAYYNEIDPYAAQWLRNLIAAGHIAPGDVDERSIVDVRPDDLKGYVQCHFFAGIGGWSYAARLAGWPDDRALWTGSCPCQPFSVAGAGKGQADERHLWPVFFDLIASARPAVVMGEQVAAAVGKHWLDGVHSDLEGIGYSVGAAVVPACAVDAPHRRDRLWFVADADASERWADVAGRHDHDRQAAGRNQGNGDAAERGASAMADANIAGEGEGREQRGWELSRAGSDPIDRDVDHSIVTGLEGHAGHGDVGSEPGRFDAHEVGPVAEAGSALSDADRQPRRQGRPLDARGDQGSGSQSWSGPRRNSRGWDGAAWAVGADGKARRIEPGIRLLAHGVPARVGKLRAYGNAIVPQVAAEVIGAYLDVERIAA